jgi:hypothetical protein
LLDGAQMQLECRRANGPLLSMVGHIHIFGKI